MTNYSSRRKNRESKIGSPNWGPFTIEVSWLEHPEVFFLGINSVRTLGSLALSLAFSNPSSLSFPRLSSCWTAFCVHCKKKRSNDSDEVVITDLLDPVAKRHGQPVIITTNRENKSPSVRPRPIVLLPPPRPDDSNGFGLPLSVIIDKTPKVPARFAMFSFLFSVTFQDSGTLTEMEAWTFILSGVNFDHPFKGKH